MSREAEEAVSERCKRCGGLLSQEAMAGGRTQHEAGRCAARDTKAKRGAKRLSLYLLASTIAKIRERAKERGVSMSDLVEERFRR